MIYYCFYSVQLSVYRSLFTAKLATYINRMLNENKSAHYLKCTVLEIDLFSKLHLAVKINLFQHYIDFIWRILRQLNQLYDNSSWYFIIKCEKQKCDSWYCSSIVKKLSKIITIRDSFSSRNSLEYLFFFLFLIEKAREKIVSPPG